MKVHTKIISILMLLIAFSFTACDDIAVTGVTLNKTNISIQAGSNEKLVVSITPAGATNQKVTWSTSDASKATVSASGLIKAVSPGNAVITATTVDGGFTATCTVIVTAIQPAGTNLHYSLPGNISFNMKSVPGGTFPTSYGTQTRPTDFGANPETVSTPYWVAETEVTYELWNAIRSWAIYNGYTFANTGVMGDGTGDTNQHPVTTINWRDSMVWCNALTEYYNINNGTDTDLECVYYTNSAYTIPIRIVDNAETFITTPGTEDYPYVKSTGKGFRLPENLEWECAARYIDGKIWTAGTFASGATADYYDNAATGLVAWYSDNSNSTTHIVKTKTANVLGIFDMSGNVWEWCFDVEKTITGTFRLARGGSYLIDGSNQRVSRKNFTNSYSESYAAGFRFARTQ